jgi:hypothetical protein
MLGGAEVFPDNHSFSEGFSGPTTHTLRSGKDGHMIGRLYAQGEHANAESHNSLCNMRRFR